MLTLFWLVSDYQKQLNLSFYHRTSEEFRTQLLNMHFEKYILIRVGFVQVYAARKGTTASKQAIKKILMVLTKCKLFDNLKCVKTGRTFPQDLAIIQNISERKIFQLEGTHNNHLVQLQYISPAVFIPKDLKMFVWLHA